jgi:hypothetical protein
MIKPRVKETTTTTGTANLSLLGPVSGFRSFVNAFGSGGLCYYAIIDGTAWEYGIGTVTSGSPDTLARTTVLDSSAAGAKLSLSAGTKLVFNDAISSLTYIQSQSVSNVASVDFVTGLTSVHDHYLITITNMVPATNNTNLWLRVSQDGGATFKAGATDYGYSWFAYGNATSGQTGAVNDSKIVLFVGVRNTVAASDVLNGTVRIYAPAGTAVNKWVTSDLACYASNPEIVRSMANGLFQLNTSAINGIRLLMSSGNITSGIFTLYGIRK